MLRAISFLAFVVLLSRLGISQGRRKPQVPCFYVFGDSLSDCGNNNKLVSRAKSNYKPYGVDFPGGIPTGRFSNGKNYIDFINEFLGFDSLIPPFYANLSSGPHGANYASGASGILPATGTLLGGRICLSCQIKSHAGHLKSIRRAARGKSRATRRRMNKCLYLINIGSNDYINNYFMEGYNSSQIYTPSQYACLLIDQYRRDIKKLYDHGARRLALFGLGAIGCAPAEVQRFGTNGSFCVDKINDAVGLFNDKLLSLVDELNQSLPEAKLIYINSGANQPTFDDGFKTYDETCCKVINKDDLCMEGSEPCRNRGDYIFFDPYHPTEKVHVLLAKMAYKANGSHQAYPTDISHLIRAKLK